MGMFDYVLVDCPIDGIADPGSIEWQTKDFDAPFMDKYRITAGGRLLEEIVHFEDRSDKTAPADSLRRFAGCMTRVHDGWKDMDYHGDLTFCGFVGGDLVDVEARFTDGCLVRIERGKVQPRCNLEKEEGAPVVAGTPATLVREA